MYAANQAAQTAAGAQNAQLAASEYSSSAQLQAVQSSNNAQLAAVQSNNHTAVNQSAIAAYAANSMAGAAAYSSVQKAAFGYANNAQAIQSGTALTALEANNSLINNLYNTQQLSQTAQANNNLQAVTYAMSNSNQLLANQNNNQAWLYSNQAATLAGQAIQGNSNLTTANVQGQMNQIGGKTAPITTSFSYGPFKGSGNG
jgi:hypothetical protein